MGCNLSLHGEVEKEMWPSHQHHQGQSPPSAPFEDTVAKKGVPVNLSICSLTVLAENLVQGGHGRTTVVADLDDAVASLSVQSLELSRRFGPEVYRSTIIVLRRLLALAYSSIGCRTGGTQRSYAVTRFALEKEAKATIDRSILADLMQFVEHNAVWPDEVSSCVRQVVGACERMLPSVRRRATGGRHEYSQDAHTLYLESLAFLKPYAKGGFGRVMLARPKSDSLGHNTNTGSDSLDVLKTVRVAKAIDLLGLRQRGSNMLQRCQQEPTIAALASVDRNPFVAKIYGWITTRTKLVVVQEFVPGGDLYSLLKGIRHLPEDNAAKMMAEIVMSIAHLHRLGILHRDLKSENVLITAEGHLKLIDFGLAADELEILTKPCAHEGRRLVPSGTIERWQAAVLHRRYMRSRVALHDEAGERSRRDQKHQARLSRSQYAKGTAAALVLPHGTVGSQAASSGSRKNEVDAGMASDTVGSDRTAGGVRLAGRSSTIFGSSVHGALGTSNQGTPTFRHGGMHDTPHGSRKEPPLRSTSSGLRAGGYQGYRGMSTSTEGRTRPPYHLQPVAGPSSFMLEELVPMKRAGAVEIEVLRRRTVYEKVVESHRATELKRAHERTKTAERREARCEKACEPLDEQRAAAGGCLTSELGPSSVTRPGNGAVQATTGTRETGISAGAAVGSDVRLRDTFEESSTRGAGQVGNTSGSGSSDSKGAMSGAMVMSCKYQESEATNGAAALRQEQKAQPEEEMLNMRGLLAIGHGGMQDPVTTDRSIQRPPTPRGAQPPGQVQMESRSGSGVAVVAMPRPTGCASEGKGITEAAASSRSAAYHASDDVYRTNKPGTVVVATGQSEGISAGSSVDSVGVLGPVAPTQASLRGPCAGAVHASAAHSSSSSVGVSGGVGVGGGAIAAGSAREGKPRPPQPLVQGASMRTTEGGCDENASDSLNRGPLMRNRRRRRRCRKTRAQRQQVTTSSSSWCQGQAIEQALHTAKEQSSDKYEGSAHRSQDDAMQQSETGGLASFSEGANAGTTALPYGPGGNVPALVYTQAPSSTLASPYHSGISTLRGILKPSTAVQSSPVDSKLAPGSEAMQCSRSRDGDSDDSDNGEEDDATTSGCTGSGSTDPTSTNSASETAGRAFAAASNGILSCTPMQSNDHGNDSVRAYQGRQALVVDDEVALAASARGKLARGNQYQLVGGTRKHVNGPGGPMPQMPLMSSKYTVSAAPAALTPRSCPASYPGGARGARSIGLGKISRLAGGQSGPEQVGAREYGTPAKSRTAQSASGAAAAKDHRKREVSQKGQAPVSRSNYPGATKWSTAGPGMASLESSSGHGERAYFDRNDPAYTGTAWRRYSAVGTTAFLAPELITGKGHGYASDYWALGVLMFQCLTGRTPFRDSRSVSRTYDNILYRKIRWPAGAQERMSPEAQDLLSRLFEPSVEDRIGGKGPEAAFEELRNHPWFVKHGVDWSKLYDKPGPYVPKLRGPMDTGYFERQTDLSEFELTEPLAPEWGDAAEEDGAEAVDAGNTADGGAKAMAWPSDSEDEDEDEDEEDGVMLGMRDADNDGMSAPMPNLGSSAAPKPGVGAAMSGGRVSTPIDDGRLSSGSSTEYASMRGLRY